MGEGVTAKDMHWVGKPCDSCHLPFRKNERVNPGGDLSQDVTHFNLRTCVERLSEAFAQTLLQSDELARRVNELEELL